jgi:hypothetical protein
MKSAHSIFVTSLEFAPSTESCSALLGGSEFSVFSVSADCTVLLHQQPARGKTLLLCSM